MSANNAYAMIAQRLRDVPLMAGRARTRGSSEQRGRHPISFDTATGWTCAEIHCMISRSNIISTQVSWLLSISSPAPDPTS